MESTLVVFSSDENFFPLARGLVLSLNECKLRDQGIGLAFIDIGCTAASLDWLRDQGVAIITLDPAMLGVLAAVDGYRQSQVCRPLLPRIFPAAEVFIWLDVDLWVQLPETLPFIAGLARAHRDKLFICPEWHYSYIRLNNNFKTLQIDNLAYYYHSIYGPAVAAEMAGRPLLNTGVFAMSASNPLWDNWRRELETAYGRNYGPDKDRIFHMAEQIALNVLAYRESAAAPLDPLFNYMCMWGPPFRDESGLVKTPLPPNSTIGIVHLSLWKQLRNAYLELGLLYKKGDYLTAAEKTALFGSDNRQKANEPNSI